MTMMDDVDDDGDNDNNKEVTLCLVLQSPL